MLFDIRNAIVSLFRNGFIKSLEQQSTVKFGQKSKCEQSVGERTKLRRQRYDEIVKKEKMIGLKLLRYYLKYLSPSNMHRELNKAEINKVKVSLIENKLADLKKDIGMRLKTMQKKLKR